MAVASRETLLAWIAGVSLTDLQLSELEHFFQSMSDGCDAMGPKYWIAAIAFRSELETVKRIIRQRDRHELMEGIP